MDGPQNFRIGSGDLQIDGTSVGLTNEDGVIVTYEPDVHLHLSSKFGSTPVKASLVGIKLTLEVSMAEQTWENILNAFAGVVDEDSKIKFGGLAGTEIEGHELSLIPADETPTWYFRNAVPTGPIETAFNAKDERIIKATFTAMVDTEAEDDDNLGYILS